MFKQQRFMRFPLYLQLLITLLLTSVSLGQDSITFTRIFNQPYSGQTWGNRIRGNYMYIGAWNNGLYTWNVSNIAAPTYVSRLQSISNSTSSLVDLTSRYSILSDEQYFRVLDMVDPAHPTTVFTGQVGSTDQFLVRDSILYIADRYNGIQIFSVANPVSPRFLGICANEGAISIAIDGNRLYCGTTTGNLDVFDLSNPVLLARLGSYSTGSIVDKVIVRNGVAYTANYYNGVNIFDVTNASNIRDIGGWTRPVGSPTRSASADILLEDNTLYLLDGWNGLWALDISNPAQCRALGHSSASHGVSFTKRDNYIFVADYDLGGSIFQVNRTNTPPPTSDSLIFSRIFNHSYPNVMYSLAPRGNYLYVGGGSNGLRTWDVSTVTAPRELSVLPATGIMSEYLDIGGNFALMTDDPYTRLLDISNPAAPRIVSTPNSSLTHHMIKVDTVVYFAHPNTAVEVYSVAIPSLPRRLGQINTSGVSGFAVEGSRLYAGHTDGTIKVFDITNRTAPTLLGSFTSNGYARRLSVRNGIVFVANYSGGLLVLDATNPNQIRQINQINRGGYTCDAIVVETTLFVANLSLGITAYDITNPLQLVEIGRYRNATPMLLKFQAGILYAAEYSNGFSMYRLNRSITPPPPVVGDSTNVSRLYSFSYPQITWATFQRGNYMYIGGGLNGLRTWNVASPTNPVEMGSLPTVNGNDGWFFDLGDNFMALGDAPSLRIVSVENPAYPTLLTTLNLGNIEGMVKVDTCLYVTDRANGMHIVSVANRRQPRELSHLNAGGMGGIAVSGNYLYAGMWNGGISVYNITNRAAPTLVGSIAGTGIARMVYVRDGIVYVANYNNGVTIYDATNPSQIRQLSNWRFNTNPNTCDVLLNGNNLFVADGWNGMFVLNVSNPATPVLVGRYVNSYPIQFSYRDGIIFAAEYRRGFGMFRYNDGTTPPPPVDPFTVVRPNGGERLHIGVIDTIRWTTNGTYNAVTIKINYNYPNGDWETIGAFLPNSGMTTWMVNGPVTTHARIKVVASAAVDVLDISNNDFALYAGDETEAPEEALPLTAELSRAYPNPFNNATTISFGIAKSGATRLDIYNIQGQLITNLIDGTLPAGHHSARWNATQTATGTYVYRLQVGNRVEARRIVLLK